MGLSIIVLAAGQGTRMNSNKPKVLHRLGGQYLLMHVLKTAMQLTYRELFVVYGYGGEQVPQAIDEKNITWIKQKDQLGTGHAVRQVLPFLPNEDDVLILYGDVPLITKETLDMLIQAVPDSIFSLLTMNIDDPSGYGRILRNKKNQLCAVIEEQDATEKERMIREVNTGFMKLNASKLKRWVSLLAQDNQQNEYYLTDIVKMAVADNIEIATVTAKSAFKLKGVNTCRQLTELERYYQRTHACCLMENGVRLADPARFDLRGELQFGRDLEIDINVIIEGEVSLGDNVKIGPNCHIKDTVVADNVTIFANTTIENAVIGNHCRIGPYSRIRPETKLADNVHIGNFVELKNSDINENSKVNHLTYLGDTRVGYASNIGAGTITCNYDGFNKHQTVIGNDVFVGSGVQLIAPVKISNGATIAAGSAITKNVAQDVLAISRVRQKSIRNWKKKTGD